MRLQSYKLKATDAGFWMLGAEHIKLKVPKVC